MKLIHYGSDSYNPDKFQPIRNRHSFVKPFGGLWTSPINSNWSWKHWCLSAEWMTDTLVTSFTLDITLEGIITINDMQDTREKL